MMASGGRVGGWVGGWFLVHFIATSWSNLQACKISSIAEILKLDRVRQKSFPIKRLEGPPSLNLSVEIRLFCTRADRLSNCPENQFQLGKNSSVRDFKFFTIDLVMVNYEKSIKNHPLTQDVIVRPV